MTEKFLHYLWKFRLISEQLETTEGEPLSIIQPGTLNSDAGPDFFDARIRINNTLWAGNVEIHFRSSDWKKHGHQYDKRYRNIILHVVYEDDEVILVQEGHQIPTLVLKNKFDEDLYINYRRYMKRKSWIPCEKTFQNVEQPGIKTWIDNFTHERLNDKASSIERALILDCFDWEQTLYRFLAINFGFKLNGHAFELLAKSLPIQIINRHKDNQFELEALLFGQAGFLNLKQVDEYHKRLKSEYQLFRKKYALSPIDAHLWNFLRLRPPNFPTIRIAQFAFLLGQPGTLFDKFIRPKSLEKLHDNLIAGCSVYWETHFMFDKASPKSKKWIGKDSIQLIIINTIVPFNYVYGQINDKPAYVNKALNFLHQLPPEKNKIIKKWSSLNAAIPSAFESQAYLQLMKTMCDQKKCLECRIGDQVLKDIRV